MTSAKRFKKSAFIIIRMLFIGAAYFCPCRLFAQTDKEFWFVGPYVNGEGRDFNKPIMLRITASSAPATVTVSLPADPSFTPIVTNIGTNSTADIDLTPWINQIANTPANTVLNKGILIKSTTDITAYYEVVSSYCNCDPEVFSLKGRNALGTEFFISSQYDYDESPYYQASNSFDIVATQNNTHVTITPTKDIIGHNANIPFTVTLNAGQTYSAVAVDKTAAGHLQGSYITSDQDIAVTLKDDLVQVSSCADLIGDQTVPTSILGTDYVVTRGFLQPYDSVYILAVTDGTLIYQDGNSAPVATLSKGQSFVIDLSNNSTFIHSNKKIYVYQLTGNGCEVGSAIIPKLNCTGSQSVNIVRSSADMFSVMIVTKNGYQNNFTVNGNNTLISGTDFSAVPGSGGTYVSTRIDLSNFVPVGSAINFSNTAGKFSLGFINGGANDGTSYGFFSDFKSSNVQSSQTEICESDSAQLSAFGGVSYHWSPAIGLNNPNIANPKASPAANTNYKVIITSSDGCVDSAMVNVKVLTVKKVDTTVSVCSGDSYKFPSGKIISGAGTFSDTILYKTGCDSLITTVHLNITGVVPSVSISASENKICSGTPVNFTAIPVNGGASPAYQWLVNGNKQGTNSSVFSSSTLANGDKISCEMTSNAACATSIAATSNTVIVDVSPDVSPSVNIVASGNDVCQGSEVTFTATPVNGGNSPIYQWFVNGTMSGTNSPTFSSDALTSGDKVNCRLTSNAPCVARANATSNSITMIVNSLSSPSISIAASQNNICPGSFVTFTATPTNGGRSPIYHWLVNGNDAGASGATFIDNKLSNGDLVSCRLTSSNTCLTIPDAMSNSIAIIVSPSVIPSISISGSQNNICAGSTITFTAIPINGGATPNYQWLVNGNIAGSNSPVFSSSTLSNGDLVSCSMTSSSGCATPINVESNNIQINVFPLPSVDGGGNKTIAQGSSTVLTATASSDVSDITWSPSSGLDNEKILNPHASPLSSTMYTITVKTSDGCINTSSVMVTVLEDIFIPNTFTPNGDGINDKWDIKNLKDYQRCTVRIFDRWGSEVFSSIGYYTPWNGTRNGKLLPFGTYYYIINLNNGTRPFSGFVALIR